MGAVALRCNIDQLITRNYNDLTFTFRDDGYFNMTKAAKCFGKDMDNFWRNAETTDYVDALKDTNLTPSHSREYVEATAGRYGGTWAHPKLAIFFARWLDVRFAVHFFSRDGQYSGFHTLAT